MLGKNQMEQFVKLFDGDEEAAKRWLEENAATRNRQIEDAKLVVRQAAAPGAVVPPAPAAAASVETVENQAPGEEPPAGEEYPEGEAAAELELDEETIKLLKDALGIQAIVDAHAEIIARLDALEGKTTQAVESAETAMEEVRTRLAGLEATDEEKKREWLQDVPASRKITITHRPRITPSEPKADPELQSSDEISRNLLDKVSVKY